MLRRSVARFIAEYNFGQPALSKEFASKTHFIQRSNLPATTVADAAKVTTMPNGARIITHNLEGATTSVGVYAEAGPVFDPATAPGASHFLRLGLTMANFENSTFQIDRQMRAVGAAVEHLEVRKRFIGVRVDARADSWQPVAKDVFTTVAAPRFNETDLERMRDTFDNQYNEARWQAPRGFAVDQLEKVAFYREPLGNPRVATPTFNDSCTVDKVLAQYAKYVVPSRVVIAGVNVPHAELISVYENCPFQHDEKAPHFADAAKSRKAVAADVEAEQYTGGELHEQENRAKEMGTRPDMESETIVAVGFQTLGRARAADFAAGLVAQEILNQALAASPLATPVEVLNGPRVFLRQFSSTGLIGLTVREDPKAAVSATIAALQLVRGVGKSGAVSAEMLAAAKSRAAVAFHSAELDTVRDYCDYLGTNWVGTTTTIAPATVFDAISKVSVAEVERALKGTAGRASLYATGETFGLPSLRQMGF